MRVVEIALAYSKKSNDKISGIDFERPQYMKLLRYLEEGDLLVIKSIDTDSMQENLTGVFVFDLVLQILAYVGETERSFMRQRQVHGTHGVSKNVSKSRLCVENYFYSM